MKWKKRGLIYGTDENDEWRTKHAMLPTPLLMEDKLRIYLGICDRNGVGRVGFVDVNPNNPSEIYEISKRPVLDIGRKGAFDDNGVVPVSILKRNNEILLYYIGFEQGVNIPYYMFGGLAISNDGGNTFNRYSESPILDRIGDEIYARCGMNIIYDEGIYKMWYIGSYSHGWVESEGKLKPLYIMKYTESKDGIHWNKEPIICMNYKNDDEHGFGRPFVWKENERYKMMYNIRTYSRGYYIGYAESEDGIQWDRLDDQAGIDLGPESWDDTNLCYPYLYKYDSKTYLFYNGNGCGKTGFGYAELIEE